MRTFAQLFEGRNDCFGLYRVFETRQDGKQKGKGTTYPNSRYPERVLTSEDWRLHLNGTHMLGIVPVLPDGTCGWFAIDIDDYSVNHKAMVVEIERLELPLVLCRSKSGGAHLYCFINGKIEASLAIQLGKKWSEQVGYPKAEIFPKQSKFDDDNAKGNWIIVPYYGGNKAVDFGFSLDGSKLRVDEFEQWANAKTITPDEAQEFLTKKELKPADMTQEDIMRHSPPCVCHFYDEGVPEGGRNNTMFHMAVYFQKRDELKGTADWKNALSDFNQDRCDPCLSYDEINQIVKNASPAGRYQYYCQQQPMESFCNKQECLKRRLGVGEDSSHYGDVEITAMTKIDMTPPTWIPRINGVDVPMDTDTLLSPRKFRRAVADALNVLIPGMKQSDHDKIIAPIMKEALVVEPMEDLTGAGRVMTVFIDWTKNMLSKSRSVEDLEKGLPFFDQDIDIILFRGNDFLNEYRRVYRDNVTPREFWSWMRQADFKRKQIKHKHKKTPEWIWYWAFTDDLKWFEAELGDKF